MGYVYVDLRRFVNHKRVFSVCDGYKSNGDRHANGARLNSTACRQYYLVRRPYSTQNQHLHLNHSKLSYFRNMLPSMKLNCVVKSFERIKGMGLSKLRILEKQNTIKQAPQTDALGGRHITEFAPENAQLANDKQTINLNSAYALPPNAHAEDAENSGESNSSSSMPSKALAENTENYVESTEKQTKLKGLKQPLYLKYGGHIQLINREQHDFHQAMCDKFESINAFHTSYVKYRTKDNKSDDASTDADENSSTAGSDHVPARKSVLVEKKELIAQPQEKPPSYISSIFTSVSTSALGNKIMEKNMKIMDVLRKMDKGKTKSKPAKREAAASLMTMKMTMKQLEKRTRGLAEGFILAQNESSSLSRLEDLCAHLVAHPECRSLALQENILPVLCKKKQSTDSAMSGQARECLMLLGIVDPPKGNGLRILSLDGGGTKGLVAIEILKQLQIFCKKPLHEVFDLICGVSTGGLIAALLASYRVPPNNCAEVYQHFSSKMFSQNKLIGAGKLFMSHAYYDTELWEDILKEHIGLRTFLETSHDPLCPKLAIVSNVMNLATAENFVFRNYTHPAGMESHYMGAVKYQLWQAIRASSAAPGYYEEFQLDNYIHQDGGVLSNNPASIAVHEAKHLWPGENIECVVSVGTGRHKSAPNLEVTSLSLRDKLQKIVNSATDTEAVHGVLQDLLPPSSYFRFNPYLSEDFQLDVVDPNRWDAMTKDAQVYCRKNEQKFHKVSQNLNKKRSILRQAQDLALEKYRCRSL